VYTQTNNGSCQAYIALIIYDCTQVFKDKRTVFVFCNDMFVNKMKILVAAVSTMCSDANSLMENAYCLSIQWFFSFFCVEYLS